MFKFLSSNLMTCPSSSARPMLNNVSLLNLSLISEPLPGPALRINVKWQRVPSGNDRDNYSLTLRWARESTTCFWKPPPSTHQLEVFISASPVWFLMKARKLNLSASSRGLIVHIWSLSLFFPVRLLFQDLELLARGDGLQGVGT